MTSVVKGDIMSINFAALIFLIISSHISTKFCEASTLNEGIYRLPKDTVPRLYTINLEPHIDDAEFTFDGTSSIVFEVLDPTQFITIHASKLIKIDETYTSIIHNNGSILKPISQKWNATREFFSVQLGDRLEVGNYMIQFRWRGHHAPDLFGFYRASYNTTDEQQNSKTEYLATTQFQPTGARAAYPCWDEPGLKAEFDVSLKHYPNYTALSNMPVRTVVTAENGKVWTRFHRSPPMSTYTSAIIVMALPRYTNAHGNYTLWAQKDRLEDVKFMIEISQKMIGMMERYTEISFPIPKIDQVFIPQFPEGAMENLAFIVYGSIYFDITGSDVFGRNYLISTSIGHELVHQWFGNLVTPAWWNEIWLSECFADFFEKKFHSEILGDSTVDEVRMKLPTPRKSEEAPPIRRMPQNSQEILSILQDPAPIGPQVIEMLEHILTEEVFRNGIRKFLNKHQYRAVVTDDLWQALQEAHSEGGLSPSLDIKGIMDPWIDQMGFPLLNVTRDYETGLVTITQMNIIESETNNSWSIPINYATRSQPNFATTRPTHCMPRFTKKFILNGIPKDDWLILNIQNKYAYQVNYDWENWKRLTNYLNSVNYEKIHIINRYNLVSGIIRSAEQESRYYELVIDMVSYLERETNILPWYPVLDLIMANIMHVRRTPHYDDLSRWILYLINNIIDHIGFNYYGEKYLWNLRHRHSLSQLACIVGHKGCRTAATKKLVDILTNESRHSIAQDGFGEIYCIGLMDANETIWDLMMNIHSVNPEIESGYKHLGCTENRGLIKKYLKLALTNRNGNLDTNNVFSAFKSLTKSTPKNRDFGFDLFIENYEAIERHLSKQKSTEESVSIDYIVQTLAAATATINQFEKLTKFFNEKIEEGKINDIANKAIKTARKSMEASTEISARIDSLLTKSHFFQNFKHQSNELKASAQSIH